ncbi:MAG: ATP cone domain-containing protein [Nanoarchaeota archaeon]
MVEHIVKRKGHKEKFDEKKVYGSCYEATLSCCNFDKRQTEKICEQVTKDVKKWIKSKKTVTSNDIFKQAIKSLKKHSKEAAFMFETHRDIA